MICLFERVMDKTPIANRVCREKLTTIINKLFVHSQEFGRIWYNCAPAVIEATAKCFLDPSNYWHKKALKLSETVGMTPPMVAEALRNLLGRITKVKLERLRRKQLGSDPDANLLLPDVIFHNLAGNLFISGWESLILANLTGACSLVRTSHNDRYFPVLFVEAMSSIDPLARAMNWCGWWPHEERELTRLAVERTDAVVAFGDDETVSAIREMTPLHTRFIGHGHKVSFILLDEEDFESRSLPVIANRVAYDFSVYDQQGCLSPRTLFVRTQSWQLMEELAVAISHAMGRLAKVLPRHKLTLEEAAAVAREREEILIQEAACASSTARQLLDRNAKLVSPASVDYLVALRSLQPFSPSPVNRTVIIRPFTSLHELIATLNPLRGNISTLGVAEFRQEWQLLANHVGATRICPIGRMQKPPLDWFHDGYQPLAAFTLPFELREVRKLRK